jgi:hypothetical protein
MRLTYAELASGETARVINIADNIFYRANINIAASIRFFGCVKQFLWLQNEINEATLTSQLKNDCI